MLASVVLLAGLDLLGAVLARAWADHRSGVTLAGGIAVFAALFVVYGKSLDYATLSTVTIGWVVLLQVGVVLMDRFRNGVPVPTTKWIVIAVVLALQAYLTLEPS